VNGEGITTYLEMRERPTLQVTPPHRSGMLLRLTDPTVSFYRYLCSATDRASDEPDAAVAERLADSSVEVFVLSMAGTPAGWFELDHRIPGEIELSQFGVIPEFRDRGLERSMLASAVEAAWDHEPERLWVRAGAEVEARRLLDYQWAGFVPYEVRRAAD
jgi:GNAT superfamily N-acetyltransferase